ncbi:CPBP family intramembrane metalloprotease, partial [Clostridium perfringens]
SIVTVLVFMLIYKIRKKKLKEEILLRKTNSTNIIIAAGLGLSVWLFNSGVLTLIQNNGLLPSYFAKMEEMLSPLSDGSVFIAILTVGIVAPFAEEFLFRGVVYKTLSKNISLKWTIVIQGILFGIYHGNLIQGIYAAFLGIIFGFVTYKTKSLIPAIIMHMVNNTIAVILPAFISEYLMSTGTNIGFIVVGSIGMIISLFFITKKNIINDNKIESFDNYGNLS